MIQASLALGVLGVVFLLIGIRDKKYAHSIAEDSNFRRAYEELNGNVFLVKTLSQMCFGIAYLILLMAYFIK